MDGDICPLCEEPIEEWDVMESMGFSTEKFTGMAYVHSECVMRSVLGGIGHHENHAYWCKEMGDPDGGRTLRQSAREVAVMVRKVGIDNMKIVPDD